MSDDWEVSEIIAKLDVFERDLQKMVERVRSLRIELFDTLDSQQPPMID